ncbi:MAG: hypothetical protein AAF961_04825, partial [Planctomycetota bacterium]
VAHYGAGAEVSLTLIREGEQSQVDCTIQSRPERHHGAAFDAFAHFHGEVGRAEMQNCGLCHAGLPGVRQDDRQTFDNYALFHGQPGTRELQDCSACHERVNRPLRILE